MAVWFVLHPLATPAHADNPISGFFSAIKDGESAGQLQAAEYALRQSFQQKRISQQYFNAGEVISQRLVNELAAKHPDSSVFAWLENHTRDSILSDPSNHVSDLQSAANLIYQEALRETANPAKPGANTSAAARREESTSAATKATAPIEPANLPPQPKKKLPPGQAIPILLALIGGIAGLVWLMRRRRKPVTVSYVHVKSPVDPADASQSQQVPAADRGTDGR